MLRKSIETRDWLNNVEPRSVRAVMKRVVEETTSIGKNHLEKFIRFNEKDFHPVHTADLGYKFISLQPQLK